MTQHLPAPITTQPGPSPKVILASYILMGAALLLVMHQGILPGLLCVCVGFMLTRSLSRLLSRANPRAFASNQLPRWAQVVATTIVILAPLALLSGALSQTRTYITEAPAQYKELLDYLAATVLELREKLPSDIADQLPDGAQEIQSKLAGYLAASGVTGDDVARLRARLLG